jgi:hypothetical protein
VQDDQKLKRVKKLLHHLGLHKELGQEATSKKHTLSLNTYQKFFSRIPQKMNPERKSHLFNF